MNMKKNKFIIITVMALAYMISIVSGAKVNEIKSYVMGDNLNSESNNLNLNDDVLTVEVEACDFAGQRQPNVKVDIGYDSDYANREYWAYTNAQSQLVYVHADKIIAQNDKLEIPGKNRYCSDEADVKGTEDSNLDKGHVIADSLGGVSNAYNITPQDSYLNRYGEQADFEDDIRQALYDNKDVTDFNANIIYADKSMTPVSYKIDYKINGKQQSYNFDNK